MSGWTRIKDEYKSNTDITCKGGEIITFILDLSKSIIKIEKNDDYDTKMSDIICNKIEKNDNIKYKIVITMYHQKARVQLDCVSN